MAGGALLLAAGVSRRFGADKRTHLLPDGTSLLQATANKYVGCFDHVVVVLRPTDAELARELTTRFGGPPARKRGGRLHVVTAAQAHLGMGHSLAAGISAVGNWDYAFVALGDMPFVETATLRQLEGAMASADGAAIIAPVFEGRPGHPVGFGHDHFEALGALTGDSGARSILKNFTHQVVEVAVSDPGVLHDVDRPADLDGKPI
jgi:molybdenum cofactor cytidylyltransferase